MKFQNCILINFVTDAGTDAHACTHAHTHGQAESNMPLQIYPAELQLNKANTSAKETAFSDLHLSISNDIFSTKIYDKRDDFLF